MKVRVMTKLSRRIAIHLYRESVLSGAVSVGLPFSSNDAPYSRQRDRQARFMELSKPVTMPLAPTLSPSVGGLVDPDAGL